MYLPTSWKDFAVLDTGDGEKLERWGDVILRRPDPQTIWPKRNPALWERADARYFRSERGGGEWKFARKLPEQWTLAYRDLRFKVHPTGFKHTGLFPEQAVNWDWMSGIVSARTARHESTAVLNLFAYTGGATMACAKAGATVCHVDAAKGMTQWARENAALCKLPETSVRWIVDDCLKFVRREIKRGNKYDGIVMDPPRYGRGPGGEVWKLEDCAFDLVNEAAQLLSDHPAFFLFNGYTTGLQPAVLKNLLDFAVCSRFGGHAEAEEVCLPAQAGGVLPCGASGRWTP